MNRTRMINDRVTLSIDEIYGDTTAKVYMDNKPVHICKVNKTGAQLGVGYKYNDSYLVIFSKDASKEQNQLDIETVYDMINQKGIQLTEENKNIFEYMFLSKKKVAVAVILQYLNDVNLNVTEDGEVEEFFKYVTAANDSIAKEEVKEYILKVYPDLVKYTNLTSEVSVIEYRKILSELNIETCEFHIMPHLLK